MNGELSSVSVAGMLRLLTVHRQTGCLKVSGADGEGKIYLEQGVIVATDRPQSDLSVEVLHLLLLQRGVVAFEAMDSVPRSHPPVRLENMEALIVEASRHADAEDLQDLLPPDSAVLQLAPLPAGREGLRLDLRPEEWNLLTRVNGEATLEEVVTGTGLPRERALQAVYGLLSAGLLRKSRSRSPRVFKVANQELDTMGEALVRQAFHTLGLDPKNIRMQDLIALLDELEDSLVQLLGPSRAETVLARMWENAKH